MTTQDLEYNAREVLRTIELLGIDFVRKSSVHNPHLQYGLDNGLYDQSVVDGANIRFRETEARKVLRTIEIRGIDFVRKNKVHNLHLQYGLDNGLYDQSVVDDRDEQYRRKPIDYK